MDAPNISKITYLFAIGSLAVFFLTISWAVLNDSGRNNLYVHEARAFLRGELNISEKLPDVSVFDEKYYVPFPPVPAILLIPVVAIFEGVKTTLIALILTFLNVLTFVGILKKLKIEQSSMLFLALGFFLGTGYWSAVRESGWVWFFAHIVSVAFMLLAIHQAIGPGRGVLAGLFLGCAILSRQLSIYGSIFILVCLLQNPNNSTSRARLRQVIGFVLLICLFIGTYFAFNWARFGSIFDTGYSYLDLEEEFLVSRLERFGLFHLAYVPFNFTYMFLQGPHIEFNQSLLPVGMDSFGTSLIFASPFVLFAFFAKWNKAFISSAWCAISLTLLHILLYYNNGFWQLNAQRFTLDFLPILILLVALSIRQIDERLFRVSVVYSVFLNTVALFFLPAVSKLALLFNH